MKKILLDSWLIFVLSLGSVMVPAPVLAANKGTVSYGVELGSAEQTYTYVFTGTVLSQGRPCPNAKVLVKISTDSEPDRFQETIAKADGSYELKVAVSGDENEAAQWTLVAQAPYASALDTVEIHGSAILTVNQNTVLVQRPIQLVQL